MIIAKVCKLYDISADTLRYYERIGLIPPVTRGKNGIRDYQESDLGWVEFIKCMRSAGISIEALIEYVAMFQKGPSTGSARKELLMEERDKLAARIQEMQTTLIRLNTKIDGYEKNVLKHEETLRKRGNKNEL